MPDADQPDAAGRAPSRPSPTSDPRLARRLQADPLLRRYADTMARRLDAVTTQRRRLLAASSRKTTTLAAFADGHERFGITRSDAGWSVREWLPNATACYLKGPFSKWRATPDFALQRGNDGVFELTLPKAALAHGDQYRLEVHWPGGKGDRMPAYAQRVVQNEDNWDAEIWAPDTAYEWLHDRPERAAAAPLYVYEAHVGMSTEAKRVATFDEFREQVLPRVRDAGYDAIQLMALAEHPYYGSFGYQVSSFFAVSSRFGTPHDLMRLVDAAHGMGLSVLMDLVHSHCARNDVEGISRQDGSDRAYTLPGARGEHPAWGSRCFSYEEPEVLRFLLSNCRFWLERFRLDGFRFDGVTSMLYRDHGLNRTFTSYADYFGTNVDESAATYLALANELVHELHPAAITVAEDVSGMPGLALPVAEGGQGFDFRYAMGIADEWIRLVKDVPDEQWPLEKLWYELTNRRRDERTISYAESHDQALVGDQTLMFRMAGERMYDGMTVLRGSVEVDRATALHKLIRLLTLGTAGDGYLNFMGNEFGHPDWIDFPREENGWSYDYARRLWSLRDDETLRYRQLQAFDRAMLSLCQQHGLPSSTDDEYLLLCDARHKLLAWLRGGLVFAVNLHPQRSLPAARIPAAPGTYEIVLDSDAPEFGGHDRIDRTLQHTTDTDRIHRHHLQLYLPSRCALVLRPVEAPAAR